MSVARDDADPTRTPRTRAYVRWVLRHGRILWIVALLIAVPATVRTASLYAHLKSDLEELLPRKAASVLAIGELRARLPGLQHLGVVVDVGRPENLEASTRFVDDLAARIRAYPPELVRAVRLGNAEERAFLEKHAALYMDVEDLETVRARIEARRDYEVGRATGAGLDDDDDAPPLDFGDLKKKYEERLPKRAGGDVESGDGRYASRKLARALLLVEVGEFSTGRGRGKMLLERVQADVQALGGTDAYAPGMRVGYAGDVAISVEELSALLSDLSLSSVLVMVAVIAVLVAYYRFWRSVLILLPPLLIAAVCSFALASLPPFHVTELNSNTAFLGSIIVGNGINFGIILLARYVEERRRGRDIESALVVGVHGARIGTFSAALAAGVAYASLVITQFRGFQQFGIVGGLGMVISWLTAFLLIPPLAAWLDRNGASTARIEPATSRALAGGSTRAAGGGRIMSFVARFVVEHARVIAVVGALLTLGAGFAVRGFSMDQLEYNFSKLRRADTWEKGEGYWGRRMDELLGTYLTPLVLVTDSREEARAVEHALREAIKVAPLNERVATVRGLDDVLPGEQEKKIAIAAHIRDDLTPAIRAKLDAKDQGYIDRLLGTSDLAPVTLDDLPRTFTTAMREKDGSTGKTVLVFPRPSSALWQGPALASFVTELRRVAESVEARRTPRVAGSLPLSADILASIQRDGPLACGAAFAGVVLVVLALFRAKLASLLVVGSLCIGVLWLLAGTLLFGVKINFANFIAFPITLGIGVDYSVNVVSRYLEDGREDAEAAIRSTGGAVALCSLTTIFGYSSLLMAQNRALFLFGLVAVLGEISCLVAGVVLLPAVLVLLKKKAAHLHAEPGTGVGA